MTTGKTIALTRRTFVGKVISLLFNMLSRLVITFLPRSKRLLIAWLQSPSAVILEPPQKSISLFTLFPYLFATKWYWCFWTVVLEKILQSPLDCKEIKPVNPKGKWKRSHSVMPDSLRPHGLSPQYSLEGLMLMLKLQYFSHLVQRTDSLEKTLMLGKI